MIKLSILCIKNCLFLHAAGQNFRNFKSVLLSFFLSFRLNGWGQMDQIYEDTTHLQAFVLERSKQIACCL